VDEKNVRKKEGTTAPGRKENSEIRSTAAEKTAYGMSNGTGVDLKSTQIFVLNYH